MTFMGLMIRTRFAGNAGNQEAGATTRAGILVRYGEEFERFGGVRMKYEQGSITVPEDVQRVKILKDHDMGTPLGYLTSTYDGPEHMTGTLHLPELAHTASTRDEIEAMLRDGLSVGVLPDDDTLDAINQALWDASDGIEQSEPITITGDLVEVSSVTIPQFAEARLSNSTEPLQKEGTMPKSTLITASAPAQPVVQAPDHTTSRPPATARPVSAAFELARRLLAGRIDGGETGGAAVLAAALADVTPGGNGAGNGLAGLAAQTAGELAAESYTAIYDAIVTPRELTGMKVAGWYWSTLPLVGDYAGDKAEIPTNAAKLKWVESNAARIAGGHDLDRVYIDLGDPQVIVSYWRNMTMDLQIKLDAKRIAAVQSAAGVPLLTAASLTEAILQGVAAVPGADYVVISEDLWGAEGAKPESELPSLLTGAGIFGDLLPSTIVNGVGLVNEVIVGKKSAVDFYTFAPPVRLEAVNVPQAGIDAGLYSYWAAMGSGNGAKRYTPTPQQAAAVAGVEDPVIPPAGVVPSGPAPVTGRK